MPPLMLAVLAVALVGQDARFIGPASDEATTPALIDKKCAPSSGDELVVCARSDQDEAFRLRPLPPAPKDPSLLTKPLRVQVAPGVSVGFQQGGGFGVKAKFGPGEKSKQKE